MPPFVLPPLVKWTLSVLGAAAVVHWVVREVRRVNAELEAMAAARARQTIRREDVQKLRRDPRTGEYRP